MINLDNLREQLKPYDDHRPVYAEDHLGDLYEVNSVSSFEVDGESAVVVQLGWRLDETTH